MMQFVDVYIALGSNLSNPVLQIIHAIFQLQQISTITLQAISHFYYNKALGPHVQPDFINAVVAVKTELHAEELLHMLQKIEQAHGRQQHMNWGARTLDLDLLLYGSEYINEIDLIIPHPEMLKRNFVLYPLFEIAPKLVLPNGKSLREVVQHCAQGGLEKLSVDVN